MDHYKRFRQEGVPPDRTYPGGERSRATVQLRHTPNWNVENRTGQVVLGVDILNHQFLVYKP